MGRYTGKENESGDLPPIILCYGLRRMSPAERSQIFLFYLLLKMFKNIILSSGFALSVFFSAQAQDSLKTNALNEVIVTATKTAIKQGQTGKVVQVIDTQTLKNAAGRSVAELLNQYTGLFINGANNALGSNQDLYLRGAAGGKTLVLIDGLPVSDASQISNAYDLNFLNPAQIERIEILKGSQSTLWGSDAVAGVIHIITKKTASQTFQPNVELSAGSYGTIKGNLGLVGQKGKLFYNLGYGYTNTKGFSTAYDSLQANKYENDGFGQNNLNLGVGYQLSQKIKANYAAQISDYHADTDAGAFKDDRDYSLKNKGSNQNLSFVFTDKKTKIQWLNGLSYANRALHDDSSHVGGFAKWQHASYKSQTAVSELFGNFTLSNMLNLTAGVQYLAQNSDQHYASISSFGPYNTIPLSSDSTKTANTALYASLTLHTKAGFNAEIGGRYNQHSIYGSNSTFSIGPSYNFGGKINLFANLSSAYKVPSLYQLYSEYGNKNLQPELSQNFDLGFQLVGKNHSFRAVAFKRDIQDLIVFFTDENWVSFYKNRDEQHDKGLELDGHINLGKKATFSSQLTFIDGKGLENNLKVNNLYRRPKFSFFSQIELKPIANLSLTPSVRAIGKRPKSTYDAGPTYQPSYITLNLNANYTFAKKYTAFADLRNIANEQYFDIVGYTSRGFNATVGLSFSY
jgi:vitamin B12 transporter